MEIIKGKAIAFTQGGPTAVINASWVGVVQGLLNATEVTDIWGSLNGIDGILNENFVDLKAQSIDVLQRIACTPATQLLSTRHKPNNEDNQKILEVLKKHNIRYVFGAGGNDTSESLDIINDAAKAMELPAQLLADLNPELRYKILPEKEYLLRVPLNSGSSLLEKVNEIPVSKIVRKNFIRHRVKSGETLSTIARHYRTNVKRIARANNIRKFSYIVAGKVLKIPQRSGNQAGNISRKA